jgi:hypothetical protein
MVGLSRFLKDMYGLNVKMKKKDRLTLCLKRLEDLSAKNLSWDHVSKSYGLYGGGNHFKIWKNSKDL